jgi:cbb3-type cytochrome oxidase maturation protein
MSVIFLLIIASFTLAVGFLFAFIWAMKNNQFEDTYTPAVRILLDDNNKKIDLKQN